MHLIVGQAILRGEGDKLLPIKPDQPTRFSTEPQMALAILHNGIHRVARQAILVG